MLDGITVVEFGRIFSVPLAGKVLADLGAKVIKIERPQGDESRHYGTKLKNGDSDYFYALNHNKECIRLDLKSREGIEKARQLLAHADVLIHNSLQKSFDALGLSYDAVSRINERIIYAAVSAYSSNSKFSDQPGQDMTIQGLSGFMSLNGDPFGQPVKTGIPVIDYVTGMSTVTGILAAIIERGRTGKGKYIRASLVESALSMISVEAVRYLNNGIVQNRNGNRHYSIAPYNTFTAKDGYVVITIANDEMYARLAEALGLDTEGFETNELRLKNIDKLEQAINLRLAAISVNDVLTLLKSHKISVAPVNDIAQAFDCPEVVNSDMIATDGSFVHIKTPINF